MAFTFLLKVLLTPCRARVLVVILAVLSSTMGSLVAIGFSVRIDDDFSSFTAPTLPSFIQRRINNSNTNSSSSLYKISIDSRTPSTPFLHNASLLRFSDIQFGSPDQIPPHFANSFGDKILLTTTVSNTANFTLQQHPKPSVNKSSAALSAKDIAELIAQANQRQGIHRQEGLQAQKPLVKDQDNQCVRITIFDERFSDIYQIIHNVRKVQISFYILLIKKV